MSKPRWVHRIFQGFLAVALSGILGIGALLGSLWLEHRAAVTLPNPTGPFAVGRATYDWVDDAATDALAPAPGTRRELLVRIWYPAAAGQSGAVTDDYLSTAARTVVERDRGAFIGKFLTRDLSKVRAHSLRNAEVALQQPSYPVVVMRGGASAEIWNYSTLAEDLASHGYVVVGFDAPYRSISVVFPDGRAVKRAPENNPEVCEGQPEPRQDRCVNRIVTAWTGDIGFALDRLERLNAADPSGRFTGRLDMTRVGVFGHSLGGATAARFCHDDSRCKAGIDVDGRPFGSVIQEGLHQPFLFLMSDQVHGSDPETRQVLANIQSIYDRLPPEGRLRIAIRGANHFLFGDDGALLKSHLLMRTLRMLGVVGIDGGRQLAVTAYCIHSFFDAYLKGAGVSRLNLSSPLYPEIEVLGAW